MEKSVFQVESEQLRAFFALSSSDRDWVLARLLEENPNDPVKEQIDAVYKRYPIWFLLHDERDFLCDLIQDWSPACVHAFLRPYEQELFSKRLSPLSDKYKKAKSASPLVSDTLFQSLQLALNDFVLAQYEHYRSLL